MMNEIGFTAENVIENRGELSVDDERSIAPRKSVVQIYFPTRNMQLSYYNDKFDLRKGDIVYVDGKLEGLRGRVVDVNYNFKIKVSEYKKVIGVADTNVKGEFYIAGSHFVAFEPSVIPYEKVLTWYKAPENPDDEFVFGSDDTTFVLEDVKSWKVKPQIIDRGYDYYIEDKVVYISIDGTKGRAIVEGSKAYEVEFEYKNGEISNFLCDCFCSYTCKHQVATMFQLKDIIEIMEKNYGDEFAKNNYFSAIVKSELFAFAISTKEKSRFTIG